jgi:hypothetical protein
VRENYRVRSFALIVLGAMEILLIGACATNRSIYEANRQEAHNACLNKPSGIERDKCLDRISQSYDEYTREREKVQQDEE